MPPYCDRTPLCCDRACVSLDYLKGGVSGVRNGARCSSPDRRSVPPLGCDGNAISNDRLGWWLNEVKGKRAVHFALGANFDDGFKDKARIFAYVWYSRTAVARVYAESRGSAIPDDVLSST